MNRMQLCQTTFITTLFFAFSLFALNANTKPNVIFILADDLGYSDLSCYGSQKVKTPHIDKLAENGLKFTNFRTGASICSPSRAAFLTGSYPQRCGLYMGINTKRAAHWYLGLHPNEITLAEQFKSKQYTTYIIGKWHLGFENKFSYYQQGFDHYYGMPENFSHHKSFYDEKNKIYEVTPLEKLTELYTARVKSIIEKSENPFFIYYAHNYPHTPFKAGDKFRGSSKDGMRGDVIQEFDWSVGEIVKTLKRTKHFDNTIIVFASDNGPTQNKYAQPFSGTKYVSLEGGHRVPFIFHWKNGMQQSGKNHCPLTAMDLFPTLSEVIKAPLPNDRILDGVSFTHLFKNTQTSMAQNNVFYYYNCDNLQAIKQGDWKVHLPRTPNQIPWWDKNKKQSDISKMRLYNLRNDPAEKNDLAETYPEKVTQFKILAKEARDNLGDYRKPGQAQRKTGSLFPNVPIFGNSKDWENLPENIKTMTLRK